MSALPTNFSIFLGAGSVSHVRGCWRCGGCPGAPTESAGGQPGEPGLRVGAEVQSDGPDLSPSQL